MPAPPVLCLMGATATGKTDLALEIARRFEVELERSGRFLFEIQVR